MASPSSPVVVLDQVTKAFGSTRALDGLSATIRPGDFVAIIGRSGAGETMLLRPSGKSAAWVGNFVKADDGKYQVIRDLNETARRLAAQK
jgi:ABC-type multidrug transport system ATPase subunit